MSLIPISDAIKMYKSRGVPIPPELANYKGGLDLGRPQRYVEAPTFERTVAQRPQQGRTLKAGLAFSPELMAMFPQLAQAMMGGGSRQPAGFQTSWGTTQGAPAQNAGGGQSMFGAPQGLPGGAPPYQPPPGPLTQGQGMGQIPQMQHQPMPEQIPGMGGMFGYGRPPMQFPSQMQRLPMQQQQAPPEKQGYSPEDRKRILAALAARSAT